MVKCRVWKPDLRGQQISGVGFPFPAQPLEASLILLATAYRDILALMEMGALSKAQGAGRGTHYEIRIDTE
mgnify:CR=1 FL=1